MSGLFGGCSKLQFLPNISKWRIDNVIDFSFMFSESSELLSLLDISKWDTINDTEMFAIFG